MNAVRSQSQPAPEAFLSAEAYAHALEWTRVDGTSDVQRFADEGALRRRYAEIVAEEPEIVFIAMIADRRPAALFRRDGHPSIAALSPERRRRADAICASRQSLHDRRWGTGPGERA